MAFESQLEPKRETTNEGSWYADVGRRSLIELQAHVASAASQHHLPHRNVIHNEFASANSQATQSPIELPSSEPGVGSSSLSGRRRGTGSQPWASSTFGE